MHSAMIRIWGEVRVATPSRFELPISSLTGRRVRPLHHGATFRMMSPRREWSGDRLLRLTQWWGLINIGAGRVTDPPLHCVTSAEAPAFAGMTVHPHPSAPASPAKVASLFRAPLRFAKGAGHPHPRIKSGAGSGPLPSRERGFLSQACCPAALDSRLRGNDGAFAGVAVHSGLSALGHPPRKSLRSFAPPSLCERGGSPSP